MALDCNTKSACVQREGSPQPCRNHARASAAATARVWIVMGEVHTVQGSQRSAAHAHPLGRPLVPRLCLGLPV